MTNPILTLDQQKQFCNRGIARLSNNCSRIHECEDETMPTQDAGTQANMKYRPLFPYFGGKSRIAPTVWAALGEVRNYVEPFFGSGATLFLRPGGAGEVETVNDFDGMVANFWRAVQSAPDEVAKHVDWPVNECDLVAREIWLVNQRESRSLINHRRAANNPLVFRAIATHASLLRRLGESGDQGSNLPSRHDGCFSRSTLRQYCGARPQVVRRRFVSHRSRCPQMGNRGGRESVDADCTGRIRWRARHASILASCDVESPRRIHESG